ncbi:MAG: hypothetical protein IJ493_12545 [Clostridia bacterium]|nr:hypothetical protein [Clostridia bacterium]
MKEKICVFCGHRRIGNIQQPVEEAIDRIIHEEGIRTFYTGNMGEFDRLCEGIIIRRRAKENLRLCWIAPYNMKRINNEREWLEHTYDEITIPDLGDIFYKQAIPQRNRWMVERASLLLCHVTHQSSGSWKTKKYAEKIGVPIWNINP